MAAEGKSVKRAILTIVLMLALPVGVAAQSAPDLVVLGPNVSNSSPEAGDTFWFIATVTNQGDERSAPTTVRYYRSTDATSDLEEGTDAVGAKGHHQGYAATIRLTAPSTAGTYYYRACVDAVPGESDTTNNCSGAVSVTVSAGDDDGGGGGDGGSSRGGGSSTAPQSATVGSTGAATASELPGDKLRIDIHGQPDATFELGIGWVSRDGSRTNLVGVIRDQSLGQTYLIVRHEGYPQIVRRWVPPYSSLIHAIDWPLVIANYSFPVEIITAIPLGHRLPEPNMLARRFDGLDDRIFAYDATLGQWRHIPDYGTFQAMGFYWCDVTAADSGFFGRISIGPSFPSSGTPILSDYANCSTG